MSQIYLPIQIGCHPQFASRVVKAWLELPSSIDTLQGVGPKEFSEIVGHVKYSSDQVTVVELLAQRKDNLSCEHLAAVLHSASTENKARIVQECAGRCTDLEQNRRLLAAELSLFDLMICEKQLGKSTPVYA